MTDRVLIADMIPWEKVNDLPDGNYEAEEFSTIVVKGTTTKIEPRYRIWSVSDPDHPDQKDHA